MFAFVTSWLTPASLFLLLNIMIGTIALATRFGSHNKPQQQNPHLARAPSLLDRVKSIDFSLYKFHPHDPQAETETTSYFHHNIEPAEHTTLFERAPSLLERVKSIHFPYLYRSESGTEFAAKPETDLRTGRDDVSEDQPKLERAPSLLERVKSIRFPSFNRSEPEPEELDSHTDTGHNSGSDIDHHVKRSKSEPREGPKKQVALGKMNKSASERKVFIDNEEEEEEEEEERVERRRPATTKVERTVLSGDEEVDAKADDFINRFKQQLKLQRLDSLLRYKEMLKGKQKI